MSKHAKWSRLSEICSLFTLGVASAFICAPVFAQSGFFEGAIAYPIAESGVTFSGQYDGQMHAGLGYTHRLTRHFRLGAIAEYSHFRNAGPTELDMHLLMPSVLAVYSTHFSGRYRVEGTLQGGFAWIYHRSDDPELANPQDESGWYTAPGIRFAFQALPTLRAQIGIGYKVIFEHFGDDQANEDSTIRYFVFGSGLALGI